MSEEIVRYQAETFMPVMDIRQATARRDALVNFVKGIMSEGQDYGKIPGTDKNTLLKPGAEKLTTFFGLSPVFVPERIVENFGDDGSEPLFFYRYKCELYRTGTLVSTGIGSCNSRESKYRWRNADRTCPNCGKPAITRSKYPPRSQPNAEPGWYCYAKRGGCGAEFGATDTRITGQNTGKIPNPDVADLVNTIDRMAQKRALIAATLIAVNASEFFTQDVEDFSQEAPATQEAPPVRPAQPQPARRPPPTQEAPATQEAAADNLITEKQLKMLHALGVQVYGEEGWKTKRGDLVAFVTKGAERSASTLTKEQASRLLDGLKERQAAASQPPTDEDIAALPALAF